MSKKIKIMLAVVAAVVVLAVRGGVVAMANGTTTPTDSAKSNQLLARVAAILGNGITEQTLTDAFKQAREETAKEAIAAWLARAIENGVVTATDMTSIEIWLSQKPDGTDRDAMKAWLEKKPTITKPEFLRRLILSPARMKRCAYCIGVPLIGGEAVMKEVATILNVKEETLREAFKEAGKQLRDENVNKALGKAVANEKITQPEADEILSWWAERPAALDKLAPNDGLGVWGRIRGGMIRFHQRLPGILAR